jgi:hypothetical protein
MSLMIMFSCSGNASFIWRKRPTKRAPDGWWAPHFELDSGEEFGSVS